MSTVLLRYYDSKKKRSVLMPTKFVGTLKPKIIRINIYEDHTILKMAPRWFKHRDFRESLTDIIYPDGIHDQHPFNVIACYRAANGINGNNFRRYPLSAAEDDTETVIIALDKFIRNFNGELSFTKQEQSFRNAAENAACGVADLGSIHFLVANYISTAIFEFRVKVNYEKDLACSCQSMQDFVLTFVTAIGKLLSCSEDYVRVFSIEKVRARKNESILRFGLTTPDRVTTEQLAQHLQEHAMNGFDNNHVFSKIIADDYQFQWKPLMSFLQLCLSDFNKQFNNDYRESNFPNVLNRGGLPYHLPLCWYRHGLKLDNKYPADSAWFGNKNLEDEWAVAFHGTKNMIGLPIMTADFQRYAMERDLLLNIAMMHKGSTGSRQNIYVATHCDRGAALFTEDFKIEISAEQSKIFLIVFQCRIRPNSFTLHTAPVYIGEAWSITDGEAVRPYGILIRNVPPLKEC